MKKALFLFGIAALVALLAIWGCSKDATISITSLAANPSTVGLDSTATVTAVVDYSGDRTVSYSWSCSAGAISGAGSTVSWTAPDHEGQYTVTLSVSDGDVSDEKSVTIATSGAPTNCDTCGVASVIISPSTSWIHPSDAVAFHATAYDSFGAIVNCVRFHWSTTASYVSIDSLTGIATGISPNSNPATIMATTINTCGNYIIGQGHLTVRSQIPDTIVLSIDTVEVAIGHIAPVIIYVLDEYSDTITISTSNIIVSSNCDSLAVTWEWSGSTLIITGNVYTNCEITLSIIVGEDTVSTTIPIYVLGYGRVTGTVRDANTLEPLVGASVSIETVLNPVSTDTAGYFEFDDVLAGTRQIFTTKVGYTSDPVEVTVIADNTVNRTCLMTPRPTIVSGRIIYECSGVGINNVQVWLVDYPAYKCTTHSVLVGERMMPGNFQLNIPCYVIPGSHVLTADREGRLTFANQAVTITPGASHTLGDLNMSNLQAPEGEFTAVTAGLNYSISGVDAIGWYDVGVLDCPDVDAIVVDAYIENLEACESYGWNRDYFYFYDVITGNQLNIYNVTDNGLYASTLDYANISTVEGHWWRLCPSAGSSNIRLNSTTNDCISSPKALSIPSIRYWK